MSGRPRLWTQGKPQESGPCVKKLPQTEGEELRVRTISGSSLQLRQVIWESQVPGDRSSDDWWVNVVSWTRVFWKVRIPARDWLQVHGSWVAEFQLWLEEAGPMQSHGRDLSPRWVTQGHPEHIWRPSLTCCNSFQRIIPASNFMHFQSFLPLKSFGGFALPWDEFSNYSALHIVSHDSSLLRPPLKHTRTCSHTCTQPFKKQPNYSLLWSKIPQ